MPCVNYATSMTIDKMVLLEDQVAAELEDKLDDVLPVKFTVNGERCELDWAATEFSDCDRITVVDQSGVRYRLEVQVLLHRLGEGPQVG